MLFLQYVWDYAGQAKYLCGLSRDGGWKEVYGFQAPAPHLAVAAKLCSSQKSKGELRVLNQPGDAAQRSWVSIRRNGRAIR